MKHLKKILEETNRNYEDEFQKENDEVVIMDLFEKAINNEFEKQFGEQPNTNNPTMGYSNLLSKIEDLDSFKILDILDDMIVNEKYEQDVLSAYMDELVDSSNFNKSLVKAFKHYASELQRGIEYDLENFKISESMKKMKILHKIIENNGIEPLDEDLVDDVPSNFDMDKFKTLGSYNARVRYCNENLTRMASGSARVVYKINDTKVLKLAKNKKGLTQNEVEVQFANDYMSKSSVANIYDYEEHHYLWVESEFCRKIKYKEFYEITGMKFKEFTEALGYQYEGNFYEKPNDEIYENEFYSEFSELVGNYDLPIGDMMRISSYGVDLDGAVVLTDYGLTKDVFDKYYT